MRYRIIAIAVALVVLGAGVFFMAKDRRPLGSKNGKMLVMTTFEPLYIFTKNVAGDLAEVQNILPQGVGPHDYAFTPQDVVKVASADVVVKQGRGIDDWLDSIIRNSGKTDLTVITASEGIEPHMGSIGYNLDQGAISSNQLQNLAQPDSHDPHLWLDPFLAVHEVENIRDGLMRRDSRHANEYARNAEVFMLKLLALDGEIRSAFTQLKHRDFVAFHLAFKYFAYEYGLHQGATIEDVPGKEPTPQELIAIAKKIQKLGIKQIFSEPQFSPKIVETLAHDYGLQLVQLDPLETGELRPNYYEEITRKNVHDIVDALGM